MLPRTTLNQLIGLVDSCRISCGSLEDAALFLVHGSSRAGGLGALVRLLAEQNEGLGSVENLLGVLLDLILDAMSLTSPTPALDSQVPPE